MTGPISPATARTLLVGSILSLVTVITVGLFAVGIADIVCR
jgi:hypothetical protein